MRKSYLAPSEYRTWNNMRNRCNCPNTTGFHLYGGRGIKVCKRWDSFDNFLADMGKKPKGASIDRINNNGNYKPNNCRWATASQQCRNTRANHIIEFDSQKRCLTEWAEVKGLTVEIIKMRLRLGWSIERTLNHPVRWKLGLETVAKIRKKLAYRNGTQLAKEFNVSRGTISLIKNGHIWK